MQSTHSSTQSVLISSLSFLFTEFDIYTSSSATEDQIDANDLPQDLTVECSDGINPAESLAFSIDIQDTVHIMSKIPRQSPTFLSPRFFKTE